MTKTCEECARSVKRMTGWTFADFFHHYFGDGTVVFVGEGADGADVTFAATGNWLDANYCENFGMTPESGATAAKHVEGCQSPVCVQANERMEALFPLFENGMPAEVAIVSAFESKRRDSRVQFSRESGFGKAIDTLVPFFRWFNDDRDFWHWPS